MSCPHCGCHLVSLSRERSSPLVCSRCNHPIRRDLDPADRRQRLGNMATLLALVLAGGVLFALSALHDARTPPPESVELQEGGGGSY
jgi:uncharacterized paraquat-inducible protein A